ncbi:MAG: hypothetical protein QOD03_16 [Verrucomicrobiota bacterium]|jgi:hypothetical protein
MKRKNRRLSKTLTLGALALGAAGTVHAQYTPPPPPLPFPGFFNEALRKENPYLGAWDVGGALRLRYESKTGYALAGVGAGATTSLDFRARGADVSNDYLMSRLRLHVGYTDKWWSIYVEGRSSLVDDDDRYAATAPVRKKGQGPESDTIDLHQAYVTLGNHKEFPLSLKVGRQELSYGEERLVGAFGWNNIGRVFDAAKARWQNPWFGADFFVSRPVIPEDGQFNVDNDYDFFSGFYATSTKVPKNTLDVYLLARNTSIKAPLAEPSPQFPQPSARDIYTAGMRLKSLPGEFHGWDYTLEGAYQFGDFKDTRAGAPTNRLNQQAFMVSAQGGYTFANCWGTPRFGLEYDYASGDSNPQDDKHETFENLFPTNHKFYGYMDFVSLQNVHDVRGIFTLKPHQRVSLALEGHGFWLADTHDSFYNVGGVARGGTATTPGTTYGVNPTYGNFVGTELDVIGGWAVTRFAQVEAGYGHFFTGDYIRQSLSAPSRGSRDADFFYAQLTVNF